MHVQNKLSAVGLVAPKYSDTTIARDRKMAADMLTAELKSRIGGTQGALVIDGGSMYTFKGIVVVYVSAALKDETSAVLIGAYEPDLECDEVYDYEKMALDVKEACATMDLDVSVRKNFC
jgi:hypothetical protein